jgi:hypothetical protein
MRRTPFDEQLAAIARVFGDRWLSGRASLPAAKPKKKKKPAKARFHKLQAAWQDVQRDLDSLVSGPAIPIGARVDLRNSTAITLIEKVASAVVELPHVSGFQNLILPRLLQPREFDSALYECEVASFFARDGLEVEFVATESENGNRRPDLRVSAKGCAIEVECKSKELITARKMPDETSEWLRHQCQSVLENLNANLEIIGMIIGPPSEDTLSLALRRIETLALAGFRGHRIETDTPMFVAIRDSPVDVPHFTKAEYLSWAYSQGLRTIFPGDFSDFS